MSQFDDDLNTIFKKVVCAHGGKRTLASIATLRQARQASTQPKPALSAHVAVCTFCSDHRNETHIHRVDATTADEFASRNRLVKREAQEWGSLNAGLPLVLSAETVAGPLTERTVGVEIIRDEQATRRLLATEQIVVFDDLAAFLKLSFRHAQQQSDIRTRGERRTLQENIERQRKDEQAAKKRSEDLFAKCGSNLEADEKSRREVIENVEHAVLTKLLEVALLHRREIRQHEARVESMLQKHSQRQEQLEGEIQRLVQEEAVNRERQVAAERKAFESTICMEPDLRKRANTLTRARFSREAQERKDVETDEESQRSEIQQRRTCEILEFSKLFAELLPAVTKREKLRRKSETRKCIEERHAALEEIAMHVTDNEAWNSLRAALERAAERAAANVEEVAARELLTKRFRDLNAIARYQQEERRCLEEMETRSRHAYIQGSFQELPLSATLMSVLDDTRRIQIAVQEHAARQQLLTFLQSPPMKSSELGLIYVVRGETVQLSSLIEGASATSTVQVTPAHTGDFFVINGVRVPAEIPSIVEIAGSLGFCSTSDFHGLKQVSCETRTVVISIVPPILQLTSSPGASLRIGGDNTTFAVFDGMQLPQIPSGKSARLLLTIPFPHSLTVELSHHTKVKGAVLVDGKVVLRAFRQTQNTLEIEFDLSQIDAVMALLSGSVKVTMDARYTGLECTVQLSTSLKNRRGVELFQTLQWPASKEPRLYIVDGEIPIRCPAFKQTSAARNRWLPVMPNYALQPSVHFRAQPQFRACGGSITVSTDNGCTMSVKPTFNTHLELEDNVLRLSRPTTEFDFAAPPVVVATVKGLETSTLQITLIPSAFHIGCLSASEINSVLQCIDVTVPECSCSERVETFGTLTFTVDVDATSPAFTATAKLIVLPSLLIPLNKAPEQQSITYIEGSVPKPVPAFADVTAPKRGFGLGAQLRLQIIDGFEECDELSIADEITDNRTGASVYRFKGAQLAWWQHTQARKPVVIHITGSAGETLTRTGESRASLDDTVPYAPYLVESLLEPSTVSAAALNVLLKSVCYRCTADKHESLKKVLLITLDDGRTGRSSAVFNISIESVDDPTDIHFSSKVLDYVQQSAAAKAGFRIMPGVVLDDPDSDNFHRGFISIDITGGSQSGDHLSLLTAEQYQAHKLREEGVIVEPALSRMLRASETSSALNALTLLGQQQVPPTLSLAHDTLFHRGKPIATVTSRTAPSPSSNEHAEPCRSSLRFDFFAESKFVSFELAERVMSSITFENRTPKLKPMTKTLTIKLTCGTSITTETITVNFMAAMLHPGAPSSLIHRVDDPAKFKPLLPQATTFIGADVLQHQGHLLASIQSGMCPGDELAFDSTGAVKVKEKSIYFGKDLVAVIQMPRPSLGEIYLIYAKLTADSLTALLRSLCFVNRTASALPGKRTITIRCCGAAEADASIIDNIVVDVQPRDGALPTCRPAATMLTWTQGEPLPRPFKGASLTPAGQHDALFVSGTRFRLRLKKPSFTAVERLSLAPFSHEALTVGTQRDEATDEMVLSINDSPVARVAAQNRYLFGSSVVIGTSVDFVATELLTAERFAALLGLVTYENNLRGLRGRHHAELLLECVDSDTEHADLLATVAVHVLPAVLECSALRRFITVSASAFEAVSLFATGVRICVVPNESDYLEVELNITDGAEASDTLSQDFLSVAGDLIADVDGCIKTSTFIDNKLKDATTLASTSGSASVSGSASRLFRMKRHAIGHQWPSALDQRSQIEADGNNRPPIKHVVSARFEPVNSSTEAAVTAWLQAVQFRAHGQCPNEGRDVVAHLCVRTAYARATVSRTVQVVAGSVSFASN
jgi:hypothetical protein